MNQRALLRQDLSPTPSLAPSTVSPARSRSRISLSYSSTSSNSVSVPHLRTQNESNDDLEVGSQGSLEDREILPDDIGSIEEEDDLDVEIASIPSPEASPEEDELDVEIAPIRSPEASPEEDELDVPANEVLDNASFGSPVDLDDLDVDNGSPHLDDVLEVGQEARIEDDEVSENDSWEGSETEEEEQQEQNAYFKLLQGIAEKWILVEMNHTVSKAASNEFWKIATSLIPHLFTTKSQLKITRKTPQFIHLRRKLYKQFLPKIHRTTAYQEDGSDDIVEVPEDRQADFILTDSHHKIYETASVKVILIFFFQQQPD